MSRRKKKQEHANSERWLISYGDFVTLLFALFVVLFSSSQVDKRKVGRIAQAIQVAFQQLGIFNGGTTHVTLSQTSSMSLSEVQLAGNVAQSATLSRVVTPTKGVPSPINGLWHVEKIRKELEQALAPQLRSHDVRIRTNKEGLVISLEEIGFFPSGSAVLKPEAMPILAKIAKILTHVPEDVRVEGHTDNVPIHNAQYASNWQLSTARAMTVLNLMISRFGIAPERLSAAGYAQYHPIASNATTQGRAANRRVDVVILRNDLQSPPAPSEKLSGKAPPAARNSNSQHK